MTKTNKLTTAATMVALASALPALAGPEPIVEAAPPASNGDWCNSLKTFGKFHSDKEAAFIQDLKFFGRLQWQSAYVDADDFSGTGVSNDFHELRRLRIGTQVQFLNNFKLKINANLEDGGPNDTSFGYNSLDEAKLSYSLGDILGLEDVALTYGRHKFTFSEEAHQSSKKIKTIERSNISNYYYGSLRPTGVTVSGTKNGIAGTLGVFSTDGHPELAQWGEGLAYYANLQFAAVGGDVNVDFVYNDASATNVDIFSNFEWATSVAYTTEIGSWEVMANALYGKRKNAPKDAVYGFVLMPSTYIIEDRLEFVSRYQYAGSAGDNLRLTSRYARRAGGNLATNNGSSNHTLYAGLNYYLCGNNSKIQVGGEYEMMDRDAGGDASAATLWAAYRMYF